jgi:hypothetical protein
MPSVSVCFHAFVVLLLVHIVHDMILPMSDVRFAESPSCDLLLGVHVWN